MKNVTTFISAVYMFCMSFLYSLKLNSVLNSGLEFSDNDPVIDGNNGNGTPERKILNEPPPTVDESFFNDGGGKRTIDKPADDGNGDDGAGDNADDENNIELDPEIKFITIDKVKYTPEQIEKQAIEHHKKYGVDWSKQDDEAKSELIDTYIAEKHGKAMRRNFQQDREAFNREKIEKELEFKNKELEIENEKTRLKNWYKTRKEELENIVNEKKTADDFQSDEDYDNWRINKGIAKNELGKLPTEEASKLTEVDNKAKSITTAKGQAQYNLEVKNLQLDFPELATDTDINELYLKIKNKDKTVTAMDKLRVLTVMEVMEQAFKSGLDPADVYEAKKAGNPGLKGLTVGRAGAKAADKAEVKKNFVSKDMFKSMSYGQQIAALKRKQTNERAGGAGKTTSGKGGDNTDTGKKTSINISEIM